MKVSTLGQNMLLRATLQRLQSDMAEAQWQQASGKKSATFSGIAQQSTSLLSLRNRVQGLEQYKQSMSVALTRTTVMQDALGNVAANGAKVSEFGLSSLDINPQMLSRLPAQARTSLDESLSMLNAQVGDRFLFAGNKPSTAPVTTADAVIDGVDGRKGLAELVQERITADRGPSGNGYVTATADNVGNQILLNKDVGFGRDPGQPSGYYNFMEFGFNLVSASFPAAVVANTAPTYNPGAGLEDPLYLADAADGDAGIEQIALTIDPTLITEGQALELKLELPDGTVETLSITFTSDNQAVGREFGLAYFSGDPTQHLDNLKTAIDKSIENLVQTKLAAVSTERAADWMFDYAVDPDLNDAQPVPRYVDFTTNPGYPAIAFDNGSTAVVERWYGGQSWPQNTTQGLRDSAQVIVDHQVTLSYGVRADEAPIRDVVKRLALLSLSAESFTTVDGEPMTAGYKEIVRQQALQMSADQANVIDVQADVGLKEERMTRLQLRHEQTFTVVSQQILQIESADQYDVVTRLLEYETQLRASYEISGRVNSLSLVNYMPS